MPFPGAAGDARRVGTHEERRDDLSVWAELRDVHREMMALEAPAPGLRTARPDEECKVVELRIAPKHHATQHSFEFAERAFELDDAAREPGAALTQAGAQQSERCCTLHGIHLLQRNAGALLRHVRPSGALRIV